MSYKIIPRAFGILGYAIAIAVVSLLGSLGRNAAATVPYTNQMVSTDSSGNETTDFHIGSGFVPSISQDGRYIAFGSNSTHLVSGDTNGKWDIFVKDMQTGNVVRANTSSSGAQMTTGFTYGEAKISANGKYVAFAASDPGLVTGDSNGYQDVFVKNLVTGDIQIATLTNSGGQSNASTQQFNISADGRYVVFISAASNLVTGDTNGKQDVFVRDMVNGTTTLISKSASGTLANGNSNGYPTISCDGAYVAFIANASNLVANDTNGQSDVFLVNRLDGAVTDVTLAANSEMNLGIPQLSCDGSTLLFTSAASNLVSGDTNGLTDLFAYSIREGTFERINVSSSGAQATTYSVSPTNPSQYMNFDGQKVVFETVDSGMVSGDTNAAMDIFIRDRAAGTTERLSMRNATTQTTVGSDSAAISADGNYALFMTNDSGIVAGDTNGLSDLFRARTN